MSQKHKSGLGRGLDSLIGVSGSLNAAQEGDRLANIALNAIRAGRYQARVQMDDAALQELTESVKAQGVIQPVIVREYGLDGYELIAGERRWRAAQLAGLNEIPAVIRQINDKTAMAVGLIENIQRENLNPIEEAQGFRRLVDEFELTHEAVAEAVGRSRSAVSNSLRLLKLPEPVQEMLFDRRLEMGHARALINLPVNEQLELAHKTVKNGWSVRETEKRGQAVLHGKKTAVPRRIDPDTDRIAQQLTETLGLNTQIQTRNRKTGKIVIHFESVDDFEHVLNQLGVSPE